MTNNML